MNCSTGHSVRCGLEGKKQNKSLGSRVSLPSLQSCLRESLGNHNTHADSPQERSPRETEVQMTLKSNLMIQ